jgi:hypothetical protein
MSQATRHSITKLSQLFVDPFLQAAFQAVEDDGLAPVCVPKTGSELMR